MPLDQHLANNLAAHYWDEVVEQRGLAGLLGHQASAITARYRDSVPLAWMEGMSVRYGVRMDTREHFDLLVLAWTTARLTDEQIAQTILPTLRAAHPNRLGGLSDHVLTGLWKESFDKAMAHARSFVPAPPKRVQPSTPRPVSVATMDRILRERFGDEVIDALVSGGMLHMISSAADLPETVRSRYSESSLSGVAGATIGSDTVYLIADAMTEDKIAGVFLHEVGEHVGFAEMLGDDYGRLSDQFDKLLFQGDHYAVAAARRVPSATPARHVQSERLAYLVEIVANEQEPHPNGISGYQLGEEAIAQLRTWLFRSETFKAMQSAGLARDFNLTPSDIAALARESVNYQAQKFGAIKPGVLNPWLERMDSAVLEQLMTASVAERDAQLQAMEPVQALGYLYALSAFDAPEVAATLSQWGEVLHQHSLSSDELVAALADHTLKQQRRVLTRQAAAEQFERAGFAMWQDNADSPEDSKLYFLAESAQVPGQYQLTYYAAQRGPIGDTQYVSPADAIRGIAQSSLNVPDAEAPTLMQRFAAGEAAGEVGAAEKAFANWFGASLATESDGTPLVLYHGTAGDIARFKDSSPIWGSTDSSLAEQYAFYLGDTQDGGPNVMPIYIRAERPFDADAVGKSPTVGTFFNHMLQQAQTAGRLFDIKRVQALMQEVKSCARREESGPHYSAYNFWNESRMFFGADGAAAIRQAMLELGFDSIRYTEDGTLTFGALSAKQVKSAIGNSGAYRASSDDIRESMAAEPSTVAVGRQILQDENARAAFFKWFDGSKLVDEDGMPLLVFRGETGETDADLQTRRGSLSFGSLETANLYAMSSNDADQVEAARVVPAYLRMKNPLDLGNDPFIDLSVLTRILGSERTLQIAKDLQDWIFETGAWADLVDDEFDDVAEALAAKPELVNELYVQAYPVFDNPLYVSWIKEAGYDGVILGGAGANSQELEYRVFDASQVRSSLSPVSPLSVEGMPEFTLSEAGKLVEQRQAFDQWIAGTQVVDADGKPLVLYHGTASTFASFDASLARTTLNDEYQGDGFFFAESPEIAGLYALASRNAYLNKPKAMEAAFKSLPEPLAQHFANLVNVGFEAAWEMPREQVNELLALATREGIDINELQDIAKYVEGSAYADESDDALSMFSQSPDSLPEWVVDGALRLGFDEAIPAPNIMPVFVRATKVLHTSSREEARAARANGYDAVRYTGPGTVAGEPEWMVFDADNILSAISSASELAQFVAEHHSVNTRKRGDSATAAADDQPVAEAQFSFAGVNSHQADLPMLARAQELLAAGDDAEEVRVLTGWMKGADGKWRYEIDDSGMRFINAPKLSEYLAGEISEKAKLSKEDSAELKRLSQLQTQAREAVFSIADKTTPEFDEAFDRYSELTNQVARLERRSRGDFLRVGDLLEHDLLFAAYPSVADIRVHLRLDPESEHRVYGNYDVRNNSVFLVARDEQSLLDGLAHELQHAIQMREGFAPGGDPNQIGWDNYRRQAGEVEARNVEARRTLTGQQRQILSPNDTADVPAGKVLVPELAESRLAARADQLAAQTETPAFKAWFGSSKVVGEDGRPLAVFHGTNSTFTVFNPSAEGTLGAGVYFADANSGAAGQYGEHTIEAYLSLQNPWVIRLEHDSDAAYEEDYDHPAVEAILSLPNGRELLDQAKRDERLHFGEELTNELIRQGFDGVIGIYEDGSREYVAFRPEQIKSTANVGTFDRENPDIRFSFAGEKASTANIMQLDSAKELHAKRMSVDSILRQTGWHAGLDGKWRFEISDEKARFKQTEFYEAFVDEIRDEVVIEPEKSGFYSATYRPGQEGWMRTGGRTEADALRNIARAVFNERHKYDFNLSKLKGGETFTVGQVLDHPDLFAAYPQLQHLQLDFYSDPHSSIRGVYQERSRLIRLNMACGPEQMLSTLLHELQHAIQGIENFARGGMNDGDFSSDLKKHLRELTESLQQQSEVWREKHADLLADAEQRAELARNALKYESMERLFGYAQREAPSGVFRLIRNELQWIHDPEFHRNAQAREISGMFYGIPKRGVKRNEHIRSIALEAAKLLRSSISAEHLDMFRSDRRTMKGMIAAMRRESDKADAKLQPLRDLESKAFNAEYLVEQTRFKDSFEIYRSLAGEIEARLTQKRQQMTAEERRERHPKHDLDVRSTDAIVYYGGMELDIPAARFSADSAEPIQRGSTVAEIRSAIEKAYGGLLSGLEDQGLVRVVQSQNEAQALLQELHAHTTGMPPRSIRRSMVAQMTAWHGTPYRGIESEGFRLDKIGTGEGAQAYGWGIYFAGRRAVAEHYRNVLSSVLTVEAVMQVATDRTPAKQDSIAAKMLQAFQRYRYLNSEDLKAIGVEPEDFGFTDSEDEISVQSMLRYRLGADDYLASEVEGVEHTLYSFRDGSAILDDGESLHALQGPKGQLYQVALPSENSLLNWDKPLDRQPAHVQAAIGSMGIDQEVLVQLRNGKALYQFLASGKHLPVRFYGDGQQAASRYLQALGIPGLKYLDGISRRQGQGAHNYVIWDEQLLTAQAASIQPLYSRQGKVEGMYDPALGFAVLIAENLTPASAAPTLMHEVGIHMAADGRMKGLFRRAKQLVDERGQDPFLARVHERMVSANETSAEEAAAYICTEYEADRLSAPRSVGRWLRDFRAGVRGWLFRHGVMVKPGSLTVADIAAVARGNARELARAQRSPKTAQRDSVRRSMLSRLADRFLGRRSELGFYSALEDGIASASTKQATAEGWQQLLKGLLNKGKVKAAEVEWAGLNEWLQAQRGPITKDAVLEYLQAGGVQLRELAFGYQGEDVEPTSTRYEKYTVEGAENYREVLLTLPTRKIADTGVSKTPRLQAFEQAMVEKYNAEEFFQVYRNLSPGETETYSMLVRMEQQAQRRRVDELFRSSNFRTDHWPEIDNIVAHLRLSERVGDEGKRVLFVEELQSDWGQQGKKQGFRKLGELPAEEGGQVDKRLPAGPFVSNTDAWVTLALKRVAVMAVEEGFDAVAFINGQQATDLYSLRKQVGGLYYNTSNGVGRGTLLAMPEGKTPYDDAEAIAAYDDMGEDELEKYVGKAVAEKLLAQPEDSEGFRSLVGDDLSVGGVGMTTFYDQIIPAALKKLLPKIGGEQPVTIHADWLPQMGFVITESMREQVKQGLPLFSRAANASQDEQVQYDLSIPSEGSKLRDYRIGDARISLSAYAGDSAIGVDSLRVPQRKRGQGAARAAMLQLIAQADAQGVSLKLAASALDRRTRTDRLVAFYKSFGFEPTGRKINMVGDIEMRREAGQQLDQTQTQAFKNWFAGSQVVRDGKPLVVYHGTGADITVFDNQKATNELRKNRDGIAWFSDAPEVANQFAGHQDGETIGGVKLGNANVLPVYLAMKNPLIDHAGKYARFGGLKRHEVAELEAQGYDGIIWPETHYDMPDTEDGVVRNIKGEIYGEDLPYPSQYAVFRPEQIKSAIGNNGQFDPASPDIRFSIDQRKPLTETEEFKTWFGGSKIVDEDGQPKIMFHGTYNDFAVFDRLKSTERRRPSMDTVGIWFSDEPGSTGAGMYASGEGAIIMPVYLRAERTKWYDNFNDFLREMHEAEGRRIEDQPAKGLGSAEGLRAKLNAQGYDSIGFTRTFSGELREEFEQVRQAVERAKDEEWSVPRAERAPYTAKRERLEGTLKRLAAELEYLGSSTEFDGQNVVVVFEPEQIKSAISNVGRFDPANPDIRNSFASTMALTGDMKLLNEALSRAAAGDDPDQIRRDTGWFEGADGRWRFEIDDSGVSFKDLSAFRDGQPMKLGELISHDKLFQAYPALALLDVRLEPESKTCLRTLGKESAVILGAHDARAFADLRVGNHELSRQVLRVIMHEVQHAIQNIEGMARGSHPDKIKATDFADQHVAVIKKTMQEIEDGDPEFGRLNLRAQLAFDRIKRTYGEDTERGRRLDWELVPAEEREPYFELLNQLKGNPMYWEHARLRDELSRVEKGVTRSSEWIYLGMAGEVEACNVAARLNAEQRRATAPIETEDFARKDQFLHEQGKLLTVPYAAMLRADDMRASVQPSAESAGAGLLQVQPHRPAPVSFPAPASGWNVVDAGDLTKVPGAVYQGRPAEAVKALELIRRTQVVRDRLKIRDLVERASNVSQELSARPEFREAIDRSLKQAEASLQEALRREPVREQQILEWNAPMPGDLAQQLSSIVPAAAQMTTAEIYAELQQIGGQDACLAAMQKLGVEGIYDGSCTMLWEEAAWQSVENELRLAEIAAEHVAMLHPAEEAPRARSRVAMGVA